MKKGIKDDIRFIKQNHLCFGCGTCNTICPKNAISMYYNDIGQLLPQIDDSKCIHCGICYKVCPALDIKGIQLNENVNDIYVGTIRHVYIGKSNNQEIFRNAQNGGIATSILFWLFETNKIDAAIVCQVKYGQEYLPQAVIISKKEDLLTCQKSSYTPIDMVSAMKNLSSYHSVAIVGTPCNIEGVVALKDYKNIYREKIKYILGLICDRSLCKTITDVLLSKDKSDGDKKIIWRDKSINYKQARLLITKPNGVYISIPSWNRFALKDPFTSPRCRICFDKLNTHADITLGDPWGMSDVDWASGESLVITRTENGENLIKKMIEQEVVSLRNGVLEECLKGQFIEKRKKTVSDNLKAYLQLGFQTPSYSDKLIIKNDSNEVNTDQIKKFINDSKQKKKDIVKKYKRFLLKQTIKRKISKIIHLK